ncbi:hypothetical protein QBC35DRAFT_510021 [Podospora australis]|uniref:C2H2-type domain-containing protein n=1 Tax=Podospora australis TaxID=1536484 RepID=A0AAN7ACR3_9PEZI|nr:hypothetical protein QBC35DRAFT_510021 [Podospora australis]
MFLEQKRGVPVHVCDICKPPKTFTRAEHLRRHQLSHTKPLYECTSPGCDKAFHRPDVTTVGKDESYCSAMD